jgi:LuxR family maltose regulon positive regulatory protein
LTLAESEGYFRFFVNEGNPMAELLIALSHAREDDKLNTYIRKLLNAFDKTKPEPANAQPLIDPLSERELEVLRLVADGLSNDEISQKLFLALSTVKGHNLRIFNKLQAKSRTEAVARARELGLLL